MGGRKFSPIFWTCVLVGVAQFGVFSVLIANPTGGWLAGAGLAFSAGVAASAVWWAFFSRYAESEGRRFLEGQLDAQRAVLNDELNAHRTLLLTELDDGARRWRDLSLPRDVYPAVNGLDLRFNRDLTQDLANSSTYFFCGRSGVYVPARIHLREATSSNHGLEDVRLWVIDPRSDLAMEQAVRDRCRKINNRGKPDDQLRSEIVEYLFMTLIGLWDARAKVNGSIRIWHESAAVVKRVELFDHAVYDSSIDGAETENFPTTVCWSSRQPNYVRMSEEFHRKDRLTASLTISSSTPEAVFTEHLAQLGLDPNRVDALRAEYHAQYLEQVRENIEKALAFSDVEAPLAMGRVAGA